MWYFAELEVTLRQREAAGFPVELRFFDLQRVETRFPNRAPKAYADIRPDELLAKHEADRGKALGQALLAEESIRNGLRIARAVTATTADTALRVRLYIDPEADQELHRLPWETLCDENGEPLFAGSRVLFSRYLTGAQGGRQRPVRNRADSRALIVVADNQEGAEINGLPPVRVTEERQRAEEGFRGAGIACRVLATGEAGTLGPATADGILAQLDHGYDILYLVCHGAFEEGKPFLYLEEGRVDPGELVERIRHSQSQPRLVFLASCESAGGDAGKILSAIGPQLVEAGIPAVIAMQEKLLMGTLKIFLPAFLAELAKAGGQIDRAMGIARERAMSAGCRDFWAPVLFSRLTTGRLWDSEEPQRSRIFNVPPLPAGFVQRPALTGEIARALTSGSHTVVQGAGGFGKTTLAIDAVRREEIADAFPDGVLWTSIGTRPELRTILSDLYVQVTGKKPDVAGLEQIGQSFAPALAGRRCLLVLDDIWRAEDLLPFAGLSGPTLLVTTRNQMLIEEAGQDGWREVPVEEMGPEEALEFLRRGLELKDPLPAAFRRLAGQLGGWPLLLDLINARLREEAKSGRGIEFVSKLFEKKGVLGFDRQDSRSRSAAVASSVEVGLERAEEMFPGLAGKAMEISIFDDNRAIPVEVLQELWGLDEFDLEEEVLRPLDNLSVLQWDRQAREVRLHRLIDRALHERLKNTGASVAAVHRRLLEAWSDPCRLSHDYAWHWYGWHCREAGELDRLKTLLIDLNWQRAKLDATDINGLLGEFELFPDGDEEIELVQGALLLSAHVLAKDKSQLAGQLLGRIPVDDAELRTDLEGKALQMREPWLRPVRPSLTAPGGALLLTLVGHTGQVLGLAVTPDGKHVVSGSHEGTLKVWDLDTGAELRTLRGHANSVHVVAVTPDGTRIVSGSVDRTIKVWDLTTGEELLTITGHSDSVIHIAITPDGTRVVSGSADKTLKVWDLATGKELRTLAGHTRTVIHLIVAPDGKRVVSGGSDSMIRVWGLDTGEEIRTLAGHAGCVYEVAVTPDGTKVVSASRDGTIKVWDFATGEELRTLKGHTGWVFAVAVTPDGKRLVSSANDETLKVWDLSSGTKLRTLKGHTGGVWELAVTPDGRRVVSASWDKTLKVWDIDSGGRLKTPAGSMEKVKAATVTAGGKWELSASKNMTLKAWSLETGTKLLTPVGHSDYVMAVAVTLDGARAVSGSTDGMLKVWDLTTGAEVRQLTGHTNFISGVSVTPDGARAVSGSFDETLKIWGLATGEEVRTLAGHKSWVTAVAVTPDGTRAISASNDNTLKIWDLATGEELRTLAGHKSGVTAVAVTPDGTRAVSASRDKTLKMWNLATGEEERTLTGHSNYVKGVTVTPDGMRAVSASSDGTLKVWDLATGALLLTLTGHAESANAVVVMPDGRRAISASEDRTLKMWEIATGECRSTFELDFAARCCAIAGPRRVFVGDREGGVHYLSLEGFDLDVAQTAVAPRNAG